MDDSFLPFTKPCLNDDEIQEVVACLRSGWLATGPRVAHFEAELKAYFNAPFAITVCSATAGLHLALLALKLQPGDEVITTTLSFVATANVIVQAGATPVFVDIDPNTLNMDLNQVADKITEKTKAIIPVHFAGLPLELDVLYAITKNTPIRIIEDCAHAMGASYNHAKLGAFGDIQVFSFHPNKNMTTGEGGVVITRDQKIAEAIHKLRFHGIDREAWNRHHKSGSQRYDVVLPGFKYNMSDIQAAIGIHQLKKIDKFNRTRLALAKHYLTIMKYWEQWHLPQLPKYDHQHAWHLFTPRINTKATGIDRNEFITAMKQHDIGIGLHYQAIHLFSYYRNRFGYKPGDFPHAEEAAETIVSLPLFPEMTNATLEHVVEIMGNVFQH